MVFAPLGLLSGVVGQFFRALSLSLSVAVLLSLALSVTLIPLLAALARRGATRRPASTRRRCSIAATRARCRRGCGGPSLASWRRVVLGGRRRAGYRGVGTGFLPPADEGGFVIDYLTPAGIVARRHRPPGARDRGDSRADAGGRVLLAAHRLGAGPVRHAAEHRRHPRAPEAARRARADRPKRSSGPARASCRTRRRCAEIEFVQLLQDMLGDLEGNPDADRGEDLRRRHRACSATLAEPGRAELEKIDGVVDVVGMQRGNPEIDLDVDPVAAGRLGLTVEQVSDAAAATPGSATVATDLRLLDRTLPVRVRLPDASASIPAQLADDAGARRRRARWCRSPRWRRSTRANGQAELLRENLRRMALVSGRLEGRDLGSAVAEIRTRLRGH